MNEAEQPEPRSAEIDEAELSDHSMRINPPRIDPAAHDNYYRALVSGENRSAGHEQSWMDATTTVALATMFRSVGENASRRIAEARHRLVA